MHTCSLVPGPSTINWCRGSKAVLSTPALITSRRPGNEANMRAQCSEWTWLHQVILNGACLSQGVNKGSNSSLVVLSPSFLQISVRKSSFRRRRRRSRVVGGGKKKTTLPRLYNTRALTAALGLTDLASSGQSTPRDHSSVRASPNEVSPVTTVISGMCELAARTHTDIHTCVHTQFMSH